MSIDTSKEEKVVAENMEKKKIGRPCGVEMMDYGKDIIRDANMRRRNEEGQELMGKLVDSFWSKLKKYPGTLFWLPLVQDPYTQISLTYLPEEKYSKTTLPCNVYRLSEIRKNKGEMDNKLSGNLVFERVLFPEGYSYPPRVTYSVVDIIRRMLTSSNDMTVYFLDPKAYKEFLTDASRYASKYSNNCEPKRLIDANCSWLKKNVKEHPERYMYNKSNAGYVRYRRIVLEELVRTLQNDMYRQKHELERTTSPGNFGYESTQQAEENIVKRINKIRKMVSDRVIQRKLENYPKGYIRAADLRKAGVRLTQDDFNFLPPQVLSEYQWLCAKYKLLHNYNRITLQFAANQKKLDMSEKALEAIRKSKLINAVDKDGMSEIMKYWDWYKTTLSEQRKVNFSVPESIDEPMPLKNAALLLAGELRASEFSEEYIPPVFKANRDTDAER